ncbi:MAG: Wzz/FepE/Etk N-terminal domain-containing protein, partial [Candidatus Aminicenantes bacterium]
MTEREYKYEPYEDEVDLMEYLEVLWKRKWLIIIPTFFLVVLAGIISFILPEKWEINTIIEPSQIIVKTEQGQFEEVVLTSPEEIAAKINGETYNRLIAADLNIDIVSFPGIKAEPIKGSKLVRISIKSGDIKRSKDILLALYKYLKIELDEKANIELSQIDSKIEEHNIEKEILEKRIKTFQNNLVIVRQRREEAEKEIKNISQRIQELEKEQKLNLKTQSRAESESLGMLLYSNVIQQSLQYLDSLNEQISQKKIEEEQIKLDIEEGQNQIKQIENEINSLKERKGRIDFSEMIKEPTSSLSPVAPNKKLNVIIAGFLG